MGRMAKDISEPRTCTRCGVFKPAEEFYRKEARRHSWCRTCFNAFCVKRWIDRKIQYIKLLGDRCADCLVSYHYSVYDFHHLESKDFGWNKLRLRSDAQIRRELAKCVLLCANCHRLRHADEH